MSAASQLRRGVAYHQAGDLRAARDCYEAVLGDDPAQPDALHLLGVLADQEGRHGEAVALIRRAIAVAPNAANFHDSLGNALLASGVVDEAEAAYRQAMALDSDCLEAQYNLANLLRRRGATALARHTFEGLLVRAPDHLQARNNLAMLCWEDLGDSAAAQRHFDFLLQKAPDWPLGRMNYGLFLLAEGNFASGWDEYEWRWRNPDYTERDWGQGLPRWNGEAVTGGALLLWGEQGVGDQILYGTMLRDARRRCGAPVIVAVDRRLVNLFARSLDIDGVTVVARGTPVTAVAQCPFGSLGRWVRRGSQSFTGATAYLKADTGRRDTLRDTYRAMADGRSIVGLSWRSGNITIGQDKSIPVADLLPLLQRRDVVWISLQYGEVEGDIAWLRERGVTVHHDPAVDSLKDMDGFAAQVAALDHVITVSNTTVHVAGALGVGTDLLLAHGRGRLWYWPAEDTASRWYHDVTIRRQAVPGEWPAVIAALRAAGITRPA